MDLKREIDLAILDIGNRNYGLAEKRLFDFLDVLDEVEKQLAIWVYGKAAPDPPGHDPAAEFRARYPHLRAAEDPDDPHEDFYD